MKSMYMSLCVSVVFYVTLQLLQPRTAATFRMRCVNGVTCTLIFVQWLMVRIELLSIVLA